MSIYLDASFLIPMLVREPVSEAVRAFLTETEQELLVSDFAAVEVASGLSRLVRTGLLTTAEATARLANFETWRAGSASTADIHAADARLAYTYVRRFELMLRAPDALHLAMAHRLQATLVTFDRRLSQAAASLGIMAQIPE
jgi:predicted nucleic acid-binding protein